LARQIVLVIFQSEDLWTYHNNSRIFYLESLCLCLPIILAAFTARAERKYHLL